MVKYAPSAELVWQKIAQNMCTGRGMKSSLVQIIIEPLFIMYPGLSVSISLNCSAGLHVQDHYKQSTA